MYQFDVSAILAVLLNNTLYLAVIALIWYFVQMRNKTMKIDTLLDRRDVVIGVNVVAAVKEVAPVVDINLLQDAVMKSLKRSREEWRNVVLNEMYGREKANIIRQKLKEIEDITVGV